MASPAPKGSARLDHAGDFARIRRDLARPRREPLRILIAGDAKRPVRTIVLPRLAPLLAVVAVAALALVAGGLMLTSVRLGASVDYLRGRVASMVAAAEAVARHPLPAAAVPGESPSGAVAVATDPPPLHAPTGAKGRFRV